MGVRSEESGSGGARAFSEPKYGRGIGVPESEQPPRAYATGITARSGTSITSELLRTSSRPNTLVERRGRSSEHEAVSPETKWVRVVDRGELEGTDAQQHFQRASHQPFEPSSQDKLAVVYSLLCCILSLVLFGNPPAVPADELADDSGLDLSSLRDRALWKAHPSLLVPSRRFSGVGVAILVATAGRLDKDNLELAPVEVVADDELVAVLVERAAGFRQQQLWIGLQLRGRQSTICSARGCSGGGGRGRVAP